MLLDRAAVVERRDEKTLAGHHALQSFHDSAAGGGFHLNARLHEGHGAGFGPYRLAGIQFDLDQLHIVAVDFVFDVVCARHTLASPGNL